MSETHTTARATGQAQASRLVRLRLSSLGTVIMLIVQFILGAGFAGLGFAGSGASSASLGMSLAFAVALACYVVLVFALPSSATPSSTT